VVLLLLLFGAGSFIPSPRGALSAPAGAECGDLENCRTMLAHPPSAPITIHNPAFTLQIRLKGGLNPGPLAERSTGFRYANAGYVYHVNSDLSGRPTYVTHRLTAGKDQTEVALVGRLGDVEITHVFVVKVREPYLDEIITVKNVGRETIKCPDIAFGFAHSLAGAGGGKRIRAGLGDARFIAVPYRRELLGRAGEYQDYSIEDLKGQGYYRIFTPGAQEPFPKVPTPEFGAEGWVWAMSGRCLVMLKHSQEGIEHSLLRVERPGKARSVLRFGGAGVWHGDPEAAVALQPGETVRFGGMRYIFVEGDWKKGYYAFRRAMEEFGHRVPPAFDPPVHWNELYDNKLWWGPDTPENRAKYYSLPQIEEEAAKASEIRCQALYLDPGWDTTFASTLWAEDRLLKAAEFVNLMRDKYGLAVSLHTPLAAWTDISAYPVEARRKDQDGKVLDALCSGAPAYIRTKSERLIELARAGMVYFMFDGSGYTGPCHDRAHGHSIGYSRQEHCRSILAIAQAVHRAFPKVIIELHDPVVAGVPVRYAPTYYMHGLPGSFDEVWAFEYMWDPMDDLLSGRAISLYYYDLAYSLPLYIHIDLRKDNEQALEFWWYASTCRHLGIGGKHADQKVWAAHKRAMRQYLRLKEFFVRGAFYGLQETIHVHTLKERNRAVVVAFNLDDKPARVSAAFRREDIGLDAGVELMVSGAESRQRGSEYTVAFELPARSAALAEILPADQRP
jgi:hypothetical protein